MAPPGLNRRGRATGPHTQEPAGLPPAGLAGGCPPRAGALNCRARTPPRRRTRPRAGRRSGSPVTSVDAADAPRAGPTGAEGETVAEVAVDLPSCVALEPDVAAGSVDERSAGIGLVEPACPDPLPEPLRGPQQSAVPLPDRGGGDVAPLPLDNGTEVGLCLLPGERLRRSALHSRLDDLGRGREGSGEPGGQILDGPP